MKFIYPYFLFAAFSVLIPIIIHFFNFRRYKTVYFSDIRHIANIEQQSQSKNQLKHLLILLVRILTIMALVFAFSKPYIPSKNKTQIGKHFYVSVYVDNSYSMEAEAESGKLIDLAKKNAVDIAKSFPRSTKFFLLTNQLNQNANATLNIDQFIDEVSKINISSQTRKISEIFKLQQDLVSSVKSSEEKDLNVQYFCISDGQKTTFNINDINITDSNYLNLVLIESEKLGNLYVDTCWFNLPARVYGQTENLNVRVKNSSANTVNNLPVNLYINNVLVSVANITIEPFSSKVFEIAYTNKTKGFINGRISINDYPVTNDNDLYFNYYVKPITNILVVNKERKNQFLNALFEEDENFKFEETSEFQITYSDFSKYQVIILNELNQLSSGLIQQLFKFAEEGNTLLIIPGPDSQLASYNQLLEKVGFNLLDRINTSRQTFDKIDFDNKIFYNVFTEHTDKALLPEVKQYWQLKGALKKNLLPVLELKNQDPILITNHVKQNIYLLLISLNNNFSNFQQNPLFVPTFYNLALFNTQNDKLYFEIGKPNFLNLNRMETISDQAIEIINKTNNYNFIENISDISSANRLKLPDNINRVGSYEVVQNDKVINTFATNYNRLESELITYSEDEVKYICEERGINIEMFKQGNTISQQVYANNFGVQLWKLFVLFAIGLILIEIFLLRFGQISGFIRRKISN